MTGKAPIIEARYSAARLWQTAAGMGISAIVSGLIAFLLYGDRSHTFQLLFLGACAAFFGVLSLIVVYIAVLRSGKVAFAVGPDGIFVARISKKVIPWSAIEAIATWRNPHLPEKADPTVLLQLKATEETRLPITRLAKFLRAMDRRLTNSDGFPIGTGVTDIDYRRLLEAGQFYLASAKPTLHDQQ